MLDAIGQSSFITTLDLAKGYWQVPMKNDDKEKTTFLSPLGLLQFTVMPFGLSSVPATFQRLMDGSEGTTGYSRCICTWIISLFMVNLGTSINRVNTILQCLSKPYQKVWIWNGGLDVPWAQSG